MTNRLVQIRDLHKSFAGVHALRDVSFDIRRGEVQALCGENGAGKSTLIKILSGVLEPDEGEILFEDRVVEFHNVHAAEATGVAALHQEATTFPDLNAVDNMFVGREITRAGGLLLDRAEMRRKTLEALERLGETINVAVPLRELPLAQRQMVGIARAVSCDCRLLIMDEPTASLSARETTILLTLVRQLRDQGVSILYVSHRLEEVFETADRVTVLRDGEHVTTQDVNTLDKEELIRLMVGRDVKQPTRRETGSSASDDPVIEVQELTCRGRFERITFTVGRGEVVGLAGLVGAGRSEVARAIFGIDHYDSGHVSIHGQTIPPGSTSAAIKAGLGLVPEDRQHEGLVLPMSVRDNVSLASLQALTRASLIDTRQERALVDAQIEQLDVRTSLIHASAATLSGGNQQKLVIGKWLACDPKALILDEPTRGVDVGAKAQVHGLIRRLVERGLATLLISSDLPELLALSDRIFVLCEGRIAGELDGATATQAQILELALPDRRVPAVT
ncbi:MAG: ABC transporter ATP-binding protein [Planctomycetaceae bacterium]|nr:ABC transporter ATP-binding protein [Planctomycetaceae bacterium]